MQGTNETSLMSSEWSGQVPSQQKRTRYTPIACDECKRRKVKCDGQTPCHRCTRHPSNCVYTQRTNNINPRQDTEWRKMNEKLEKLQEQVNLLVSGATSDVLLPGYDTGTALASPSPTDRHITSSIGHSLREGDLPRTGKRRKSGKGRHPQYMGPTSTAFSFGVARTSLQEMGIQSGSDHADGVMTSNLTTPVRTPPPCRDSPSARDPLLRISLSEATRLVEVYEEESGTVYPFVDIKLVLNAAEQFYRSATPTGAYSTPRIPSDENTLSGGMLDILKLVIAIASVFEGHSPTALSHRLVESVERGFEGRLCGPSVDVLEIQAWTLMSILQFHCDEEAHAWRTIGLAARAAVELGLHRRDTYFSKFPDPIQRLWANKLFWCIYVLDRRWSFGTGLPFALHDDDIDPVLPEQDDTNSPLLTIMIAYGQLGSKVWRATAHLTASVDDDTLAFLDFQVGQWQDSISPDLRLHSHDENMLEGYSRTKNRLRVLLYLRANQMRLLIFRRALLSSKTIADNITSARRAVNTAKDNICLIDRLNRLSDIYSSQQTSFNYFLVSALAVVLLAVCHATAEFNESCRGEFYMALDLVRGLSGRSHVARRLWKTVKHLKVIGPKLGVFPTPEQNRGDQTRRRQQIASHPNSNSENNAASASEIDISFDFQYTTGLPFGSAPSSNCSFPLDGVQLSNELTNFFETIDSSYGQTSVHHQSNPGAFDMYTYEPSEDLSRSLLGLF